MLTKITIQKLIDSPTPGDKKPSHAIVAADENYNHKTTIGKLWMKENERGKFLSGELAKPYEAEDGTFYDGYVILSQKEYDALVNKPSNVDTGEANIDDIPF